MSILDKNTIDLIQVKEADSIVRLIATDHIKWGPNNQDDKEHMLGIQEKINDYLKYIESGQLFVDYPGAEGFRVMIQIYGAFDRPDYAVQFYHAARALLNKAGYELEFVLHD